MEVPELCPREGPGWVAPAAQVSRGLLALQAAASGPFPLPCRRRDGQPRGRPRMSCCISPSLGVCWMLLGAQGGACTPSMHL